MTAITIFCTRCSTGYAAVGFIPTVCPACEQDTTWTTHWPVTATFPFKLTVDDRRFLRSLRIARDKEPPPG